MLLKSINNRMNNIILLTLFLLNISSLAKKVVVVVEDNNSNNITTITTTTTTTTSSSSPSYIPTLKPSKTSKPSKTPKPSKSSKSSKTSKPSSSSSSSSSSSPSSPSSSSSSPSSSSSSPSSPSLKPSKTYEPTYEPPSSTPSYIPTVKPSKTYEPTYEPSIKDYSSFENVYYPNGTLCSSFGIYDLASYKYNLPITSIDKKNDDLALYVPIYSSNSLIDKDSSIKHAIIAVHGYLRNADEMLCLGLQTAKERTDTIIIAPYFSSERIEASEWGTNLLGSTSEYISAYWDSSSWISGGDNVYDSRTSYDVLDNLVDSIGNSGNFPGLEIISVAGYSAGAQMVNRYAWATDIDRNATSKYDDWKMRYIISDASSYLYLDANRPIAKCIPLRDKGDDITCSDFEVPSAETIGDCDNYDEWKYGISEFPDSGYTYLTNLLSESDSLSDRTDLFLQKDIRYVFGRQDSCNCNQDGYLNKDHCYVSGDLCSPSDYGGTNCCDTYPDSYSNDLSTTCGSNLQGYNRLQRGLVYMSYLEWYSGIKPTYTTMDMMHNCTEFFLSDELKDIVFDVEGLTFNDFIISASLDKDLTTIDATVVSKHKPAMQVNSQYTLIILGIFFLIILIGNVIINNVLSIASADSTNRGGTRLTKRDFTDGDGLFE